MMHKHKVRLSFFRTGGALHMEWEGEVTMFSDNYVDVGYFKAASRLHKLPGIPNGAWAGYVLVESLEGKFTRRLIITEYF